MYARLITWMIVGAVSVLALASGARAQYSVTVTESPSSGYWENDFGAGTFSCDNHITFTVHIVYTGGGTPPSSVSVTENETRGAYCFYADAGEDTDDSDALSGVSCLISATNPLGDSGSWYQVINSYPAEANGDYFDDDQRQWNNERELDESGTHTSTVALTDGAVTFTRDFELEALITNLPDPGHFGNSISDGVAYSVTAG